ncbi:MAG TPA: TadE family protein [Phototrophicaceae bacterium]|nr:TadE family protein [Phototrophicaceae bacterium]
MTSRRPVPGRRDGGATSLELAIIAPMFLTLVFLAIQAGLFFYGRTVAVQAAREGVSQLRLAEDAAAFEAMRGGAVDYTRDLAATVGQQGLLDPQVRARYDDAEGRVWVSVTGRVISLVPGLDLTTTAEASGTVERFREPNRP